MLPCRQHQHECTADWIWTPGQSCVRNAFHTTRESSISPAVSSAEWGWDCFSSTLSATCREPWPCECLPRSVGRRFWPWPIEDRISASGSLPSAHDSISAAQRSTASYCRLFARCSQVVGQRPEFLIDHLSSPRFKLGLIGEKPRAKRHLLPDSRFPHCIATGPGSPGQGLKRSRS